MNRFFLGAAVALVMMSAAEAQVRNWGFAKDTVFDWKAGQDSVTYTNMGPDTLAFDSVWMEIVSPVAPRMDLWCAANHEEFWINVVGESRIRYGTLGKFTLASGQSGILYRFFLEDHRNTLGKQAAIAIGDTLVARVVFSATNGRGRDTLIVKGRQDFSTPIYPGIRKLARPQETKSGYDPRGRLVERDPQSRPSLTPIFKPVR